MLLNKISDKLVFNFLSKIDYGYLEIKTFDGEILKFGNPEEPLSANIIIKKPNFNFNLIRGGSIGFAECPSHRTRRRESCAGRRRFSILGGTGRKTIQAGHLG